MATDLYAPCPCGSGKKFKWCCQPIHGEISRAFQLDQEGQHEAALRMMDEVVAQHADNPEAWGRLAQLRFENGQPQEAEQALDKALALNPQYAFGHFLKGKFRYYEGELPGALILFRKAAELYDPEAHDLLAQIHVDVFDAEMKLNRPVAAHAAAELALRHSPANEQLRQGLDAVYGPDNPNLPAAAKQAYQYKPMNAAGAEQALAVAQTGKLADAVRAFGQLTAQDANNAAAWYNLGLTQAWLGNHPAALDALDRYVALETDEAQAVQAWALAEVLRLGQGMEDQADYVEYSYTAPLRDPQQFLGLLGELEREKQLAGVRVSQEEGVLTAVLLEEPGPVLTPEAASRQSPKLAAYLVLMAGLVRVWSVVKESADRAFNTLRQRAGAYMGEPFQARGPAKFHDVLSEALTFPRNAISQEDAQNRLREGFERFFEEVWLHRPLKSLGGVPPVDAAGHAPLRRKVLGVVQFLQECAALAHLPYDFDRLRRKLGLSADAAPAATPAGAGRDIPAMSTADLASLLTETLTEVELEQAFQTALKLDARELAGKFAGTLVDRPAQADRPDRYPLYNHLIQQAQAARDFDAALGFVDAGERYDCESNDGRRRNDYELRRGQFLAKRGDVDQAQDVFDRLIQRSPDELRFRATAAETMLSAKQGSRAARYAQDGLEAANKQQNRDSAEHFKELLEAAKR